MPLYEYKCKKCQEKFELRRSFFTGSQEKVVCPKCGSTESERVYSAFTSGSGEGSSCSNTPARRFG